MGAGSIWWVPVLFGGSWWCLVAAAWWLTLLGRLEPFFLFWQQGGCFFGKEVLAQQPSSMGVLPAAHCNVCCQAWSSILAICIFLQVSAEPQMPLHLYAR